VRAAAAGDGPRVRRSAVLLALAGPCRLLERVAPDRSDRRHAKTRINDATARAPFGSEVMQVIDEFLPPSSLLGDPAPAGPENHRCAVARIIKAAAIRGHFRYRRPG